LVDDANLPKESKMSLDKNTKQPPNIFAKANTTNKKAVKGKKIPFPLK